MNPCKKIVQLSIYFVLKKMCTHVSFMSVVVNSMEMVPQSQSITKINVFVLESFGCVLGVCVVMVLHRFQWVALTVHSP